MQSPRVLASFTDVPGGALEHLGALTFPTYAAGGGSQVASTRMLVMPSSVEAGQPFLGRITRHELSHIAVGIRDNGAPAWVSEGLAEYLGAREIPLRDRIIPTSALSRAESQVTGMPESKDFNNTDQEWHYALSWMACDYIAGPRVRPACGSWSMRCTTVARAPATRSRTACWTSCSGTTPRSSPRAPLRGSATCTAESRLTTAVGHTDRDRSVVRTRVWRSRTTACQPSDRRETT